MRAADRRAARSQNQKHPRAMPLALALTLAPALVAPILRPLAARGQNSAETASARPGALASPADAAIGRALQYLKTAQKPDGAWEAGGFGRATSITSLAVMAYLASGHVPGEPG